MTLTIAVLPRLLLGHRLWFRHVGSLLAIDDLLLPADAGVVLGGGDAAIMVDAYHVERLPLAIKQVLTESDLLEELRQKGLARAQQFTWERTARETMAVYREVSA